MTLGLSRRITILPLINVDTSRDLLFARYRDRNAPLPETAIERLMDRWEVPDPTEAQDVEWRVDGNLA